MRRRTAGLTLATVALAAAAALGVGCSSTPTTPLPTVAAVDLARYQGTWYEVASQPNPFQRRCVADTRAHYRRDGDVIRVDNRCRQADGTVADAQGVAKVVPDTGNAQLRVSFFRPFYGDYWVLAFGDAAAPDYRWVLVGEPQRRYAWLLSRTPTLPEAEIDAALSRAEALGYARSGFQRTPQTRPID